MQTNGSNSLKAREMDPIRVCRGRVTTRSKTETPTWTIHGCGHTRRVWIHPNSTRWDTPKSPKSDHSGGQTTPHMNLSTCKRMGPTAWRQGKRTQFGARGVLLLLVQEREDPADHSCVDMVTTCLDSSNTTSHDPRWHHDPGSQDPRITRCASWEGRHPRHTPGHSRHH